MAVYDWICLVDPPSGAKTMQRTHDLLAHIATTFTHRKEATDQLHALLEKDPRSKRVKRVRDHQKWHEAGRQAVKQNQKREKEKQAGAGGGGDGEGGVGHGGARALSGVTGFEESSTKEDFAQIWHEAAHLARACVAHRATPHRAAMSCAVPRRAVLCRAPPCCRELCCVHTTPLHAMRSAAALAPLL